MQILLVVAYSVKKNESNIQTGHILYATDNLNLLANGIFKYALYNEKYIFHF